MKKMRKKQNYQKTNQFQLPLLYLVLSIAVLFIYGKTSSYDFTIDDKIIIVENPYVKSGLASYPKLLTDVVSNDMSETALDFLYFSFRPIPMFTHALDISVFGAKAGPQHMVNIVIYLILSPDQSQPIVLVLNYP